MNEKLKERVDIFVKNRDIMKENFKWDDSQLYPLCSSLYTDKLLYIDPDRIKQGKEIIKKNTGVFSSFKSTSFLPLATILSLEEDMEATFNEVLRSYNFLRNEFTSSSYLPLSAFMINKLVEKNDQSIVVRKSKDIYKKMKNEHPLLTSSEDSGFAVLFAIYDKDSDEIIEEMEKCYKLLRNEFFSANAVQALSQVLALSKEDSARKCEKVMSIFNKLKIRDCKFGTGTELAILGLLAMVTDDVEQTVEDIVEVNNFLNSVKGFGAFAIGKVQRIMYAAILVAQEYKKECIENEMNIAAINSITSIIIAQQVALMAVITSSAAASSAAASSSI